MNLKALLIDDEPLAHKVILAYAKDIPHLEIVGQCYLATEAFSILQNQEIDVLFLDINMPKISGLDFLKTLKRKPIVIITSAYEEYALQSFELDVCDYLLKPFRFDRFLKAINKAQEYYDLKNGKKEAINSPKTTTSEEFPITFIKSDKRMIQIDFSEVFYLESYGNYVKIWLENEYHLTPATLSSFEAQLSNHQFFRIHKSFIIQLRYVNYLEGNTIVLSNQKTLPIGKSYRQKIKEIIGK